MRILPYARWLEHAERDPETLITENALDAILSTPRYCGVALWQMADCKSYVNTGHIRNKPRGFNCAGLLDEYRRPKLAFDTVKRLFHHYTGKISEQELRQRKILRLPETRHQEFSAGDSLFAGYSRSNLKILSF